LTKLAIVNLVYSLEIITIIIHFLNIISKNLFKILIAIIE